MGGERRGEGRKCNREKYSKKKKIIFFAFLITNLIKIIHYKDFNFPFRLSLSNISNIHLQGFKKEKIKIFLKWTTYVEFDWFRIKMYYR